MTPGTTASTNVNALRIVLRAVADEVYGHAAALLGWRKFISLPDFFGTVKVPLQRPQFGTIRGLLEVRSDTKFIMSPAVRYAR